MKTDRKCAVFILLGQSNAVGHGVPMCEADRIVHPLNNVFGLSREQNQSFDTAELIWSGYTSAGMNLAEEQDHTYSLANCLAHLWQKHIDDDNPYGLPDLYIIHIAIGAQGVTPGYMWHPDMDPILIPGRLGVVNIALFPFCRHIFSLLDDSFARMNREYEVIGIHWRGGENDATASKEILVPDLKDIYTTIFDEFRLLLPKAPVVFHKIVCSDRMNDLDPSGGYLDNMHFINHVFDDLCDLYDNASVFDVRCAPQYIPDVRGNGLFIEDAVHFTAEVNQWIAGKIITEYSGKQDNQN